MYDSYDQCRVPQRRKIDWEEQFYKALSSSRDPKKSGADAEWIVFARLLDGKNNPLSAAEREAMDDCLFVLRRFQVEQLNYPPLDSRVDSSDASSEQEQLIEMAFEEIVGRPMLLREKPYFMRRVRRA